MMIRLRNAGLLHVAVAAGLIGLGGGVRVCGQGMISGNVRAEPKGKPSGRPWGAEFRDVAAEAGLNFVFTSGDEKKKRYVIEANGSGVAWVDYDNDGRLDAYLVNGSRLTGAAATNRLYRNSGGGRFLDVTEKAGLARGGWGNGVCVADVNNDGFADLYVTYFGRNSLYRNDGKGRFEDVAAASGTAGDGRAWSTGCSFIDYDRDGHVDLLVTSYLGFEQARAPLPGAHPFCYWKGKPVYCGPRGMPPGRLTLYHNKGDGTFEDVSERAGVRAPKNFYAFTALTADLDGDGWADLYVACDSTPSIFLRNNKDGTFTDLGTETGLAYSDNGAEQAGMGVAAGDYDNDGLVDITKTNFIGDYPNLYRNLGRGIFTDIAIKAGLGVNPQNVLWGVGLEDLDNDGHRDLLQVTGHVYPEVAEIDAREHYRTAPLVYRNLGNGKFEDVTAMSGPAMAQAHSSRGAAFGDYDNDGDVDVLVMNMHEAPSLMRNELKAGRGWVKFKLTGVMSNRVAIGARVMIEAGGVKQSGVVLSQSSFLSVNDPRLHFGLGAAEKVERVVVVWPAGQREEFGGVEAGRLYELKEGSGRAEPLTLPR